MTNTGMSDRGFQKVVATQRASTKDSAIVVAMNEDGLDVVFRDGARVMHKLSSVVQWGYTNDGVVALELSGHGNLVILNPLVSAKDVVATMVGLAAAATPSNCAPLAAPVHPGPPRRCTAPPLCCWRTAGTMTAIAPRL